MTDELKKLIIFLLKLAGAGTIYCIVILMMPILASHIDVVSTVSHLFGLWTIEIVASTFAIVVFSIFSLLAISQAISHIGIYHKLKNSVTGIGETFWTKVCKVFKWNFLLTIFIFFTIINIIQPSTDSVQKFPSFTQIDVAFLCATMIIPGYLLSLRLLANPGDWIINLPFKGRFTQSETFTESVKIFKERILSFYFSLIGVVFMYILIKFLYEGVISVSNTDVFSSNFIADYIPHLPILIIALIPYLIALALTTIVGELILKYAEPIEQI
jgi:hypothetical protein